MKRASDVTTILPDGVCIPTYHRYFHFSALLPHLWCLSQFHPDSVPSCLIWTIALLCFHHANHLVSCRCESIAPKKKSKTSSIWAWSLALAQLSI